MKVGGLHRWVYPDGHWTERKVAPDRWAVTFSSRKRRRANAPRGSGAEEGSQYHWFIVAHQWADKLDANTYATHMEGSKFLLGFKKPGWRGWSTQQRGRKGARERAIAILERLAQELRDAPAAEFEDPEDEGTLAEVVALGPVEDWRDEGAAQVSRSKGTRKARTPRTASSRTGLRPSRSKAGASKAQRRPSRAPRTPRSRRKPPADLDGMPNVAPEGPSTSF